MTSIAPVIHCQCVLTDKVEGPGFLTMPDCKGFQFVACNIASKQDCYPALKSPETWH